MSEMDLTPEEIKIIRKALQIVLMAHICVETNEGHSYEDTKVDALLGRFREFESKEEGGN